jgi:hypothetical protein
MYRRTDDVERLQKVIDDTDKQLVDCLQQIKMLGEAAQQVLEVVDPQEDAVAAGSSLVERLRGAPQKILSYVTEASTTYISHTLGLVRSFWPEARLDVLAKGMAEGCSEEQFREYRREARPMAEKIVESLEQD